MENDKEIHQNEEQDRPPLLLSCRLHLAIFCLLAFMNVQARRFSLSFALICMVKAPQVNSTYQTVLDPNTTEPSTLDGLCQLTLRNISETSPSSGEFEWSKQLQSHLIGALFYGSMLTPAFGGWLSDHLGGKRILIFGLLMANFMDLTIPVAARFSPILLFAIRFLQGCVQELTSPAVMVIIIRWAAPTERSFLLAIVFAGYKVASATIYPFSGYMCQYQFDNGWPLIFYISGTSGTALCIIMCYAIYDMPEQHPRISQTELNYLKHFAAITGRRKKNHKVPWVAILLSVPVYAYIFTHLFSYWAGLSLRLSMPMFMKEVLSVDVRENGMLSGFLFAGTLASNLCGGKLYDHLRSKNICKINQLRLIFNTIGMLVPGMTLIILAFMTCHEKYWAVAVTAFGQMAAELAVVGGYAFSVMDLAPRFSGLLIGITSSVGTASGFMAPVITAALTPQGKREEWENVLYLTSGLYFLAAAIYLVFGSSKLQSWARDDPKKLPEESPEDMNLMKTGHK